MHYSFCAYQIRIPSLGNCGMNSFDDWTVQMLLDDTECGDECPRKGSYWNASNVERIII